MPAVRFEIDSCVWPSCGCGGESLIWVTVSGPLVWRDESGRLLRKGPERLRMAECGAGTRYWIMSEIVEDAPPDAPDADAPA